MKLEFLTELLIGVFWIVVGDDPLMDASVFAEDCGIGNGGVAPAYTALVL